MSLALDTLCPHAEVSEVEVVSSTLLAELSLSHGKLRLELLSVSNLSDLFVHAGWPGDLEYKGRFLLKILWSINHVQEHVVHVKYLGLVEAT